MSTAYTEADYENSIIELFAGLGYTHVYGPDVGRNFHRPLYTQSRKKGDKTMNAKMQTLMNAYIRKLKTIYQGTLQSVILYGSYARGDEAKTSDIDVLVLVNIDEDGLRTKNEALVYMTYDFNMEHNTDIEPIAESVKTYHYWIEAHPFYQNVRREGVVLYDAA